MCFENAAHQTSYSGRLAFGQTLMTLVMSLVAMVPLNCSPLGEQG
jgi:hypothetical protein